MERKIRIFENFALVSNIIPYYSYSHSSYLLLAQLCKGSRMKLYEFYQEFKTIMRPYCILIAPESNSKLWNLPWDLFWFSFQLEEYQQVLAFINFIENVKERRGWYFIDHYLSDQIYIDELLINVSLIQHLHSYLDDLKSIEVYNLEYY